MAVLLTLITALLITFVYFSPQGMLSNKTVSAAPPLLISVGQYSSIALGSNGLPIISYYDKTNGNLKIVKCGNTTCSSVNNSLTTLDSNGNVGLFTSMAIGSDNRPVISYFDATNNRLKILKCGNASCNSDNIVNNIGSRGTGQYNSIAVDQNNKPIISYFDSEILALKVVKCRDISCSSGNVISIIDFCEEVCLNTPGLHTSIAIGSDSLPIISYSDFYNLKVVKCGDPSCEANTAMQELENGSDIGYTSMAIGIDGLPIISYRDGNNNLLKTLKCGDLSCSGGNTVSVIDSGTNIGQWSSIAVLPDGRPVISYYDGLNGRLKYAYCNDPGCLTNTKRVLDGSPLFNVGEYTSLIIGAGVPFISYYDKTNEDLKMLKCGNPTCASENSVITVDDPPLIRTP